MRNTILTKSLITVSKSSLHIRLITPLYKNFADNQPLHNHGEKNNSPCLFSHNRGMNTITCVVLQPHFPPIQLKSAITLLQDTSSALNVLMVTCNGIQKWICECLTKFAEAMVERPESIKRLYGITTISNFYHIMFNQIFKVENSD